MAKAKSSPIKSIYSVHPGVKMTVEWIATLKQKTGRSLDEWLAFVKKSGPKTEKERRVWLKNEHNLGANTAWWIAERAEGRGLETSDPDAYLKAAHEYVEAQFDGKKQALRPLYDELLKIALKLGDDVKACPCKNIVPLYRNHVFAQLKATTQTRIDLGLALGNDKAPKRLIDTGGYEKKDRITRRIPIESPKDIDDEVCRWLKIAYERDA
ncbi:MAG TPA: DUF5655 domain-containing protein [Blastocatellia bacterium]|nr:DUF5655 domain-containing protein [Blastocatellia bacterium]